VTVLIDVMKSQPRPVTICMNDGAILTEQANIVHLALQAFTCPANLVVHLGHAKSNFVLVLLMLAQVTIICAPGVALSALGCPLHNLEHELL
jgi:hypothetical protein